MDVSGRRRRTYGACVGVLLAAAAALSAAGRAAAPVHAGEQNGPASTVEAIHAPFDTLLDLYVRDGLVYYRALKSERSRFDRYVAALDVPPATYQEWPRERQMAFWINAYNAFVIETVLDRYPIRGRSPEYPPSSIRQIPGAFDAVRHRAAGRTVTLDEIERTLLAGFGDPRVFLALGRGSIGGGRLVSAAYMGERLESQLAGIAAECVTRQECARFDASARQLAVSPVFSWRQQEFTRAHGEQEMAAYPGRSPLERAILALLAPHFLPGERMILRQNDFAVTFSPYDWRLNDLTGGPPPR
jgi:hypothetical protein